MANATNCYSEISNEAPSQKENRQAWIVCFTAALFFFYEFIQMNMFNVLSGDLLNAFNISAEQLGVLSAYCFYATIVFLLPAGQMLDRYSTKKIILIALGICVLGTAGLSMTSSLAWAHLFRFMAGIGSAFCFLSSVRLASRWFHPRRLALVVGLIVTMAMTGGMVAQTPLSLLNQYLGWRHTILSVAGLGAFILFLVLLFVQDYPKEAKNQHQEQKASIKEMGYWSSMFRAYLNLQNWLGGLYTSLLNLPIVILGSLWGGLYLQQVYHFSASLSASITSTLFLGAIIGCPIAGWLSDKIGLRRMPMIVGALLSLATILILLYLPHLTATELMLGFFTLGFVTSAQVISYPTIAESNSPALTAMSVSIISISTQIGFAVFQPAFGKILDQFWNGVKVNGVPVYSAESYHAAMIILPISFVIALIAAIFMKETYCKKQG